MMMLAEACIIGGTMDGCSHLGIAEREGIMVRRKGHEGASQMARELHRDRPPISRGIGRNGWQGPAGRRCRAPAAQRKEGRRRLAAGREVHAGVFSQACFLLTSSCKNTLRDWLPKGESLDDVSDSEVQEACDSLIRKPRKRLKRKCPWEAYRRQSLYLL